MHALLRTAASDIIRRAMMRMPGALAEAGLATRMLLQVHDELVFEAPEAEAPAAIALIKRVMEGAAEPAVALTVPYPSGEGRLVWATPGRDVVLVRRPYERS